MLRGAGCGCPKIGTGTTATLPTQSNYLARPRGEICGNYSGADQTNANAGDPQHLRAGGENEGSEIDYRFCCPPC